MPKTKFQEVIFTVMMVFVMVYAMVCYNIALSCGKMSNAVFINAINELPIMMAVAFIVDFFAVGHIAKYLTFRIVNPKDDNPFHIVLGISAISVAFMCPVMSLAATLMFKNAGTEVVSVWLQTTALNYPMAFFWQLFFAGPLVRFIFKRIFRTAK